MRSVWSKYRRNHFINFSLQSVDFLLQSNIPSFSFLSYLTHYCVKVARSWRKSAPSNWSDPSRSTADSPTLSGGIETTPWPSPSWAIPAEDGHGVAFLPDSFVKVRFTKSWSVEDSSRIRTIGAWISRSGSGKVAPCCRMSGRVKSRDHSAPPGETCIGYL